MCGLLKQLCHLQAVSFLFPGTEIIRWIYFSTIFYIPSLTMDRHRLKDAKRPERPSSGEQAAATRTTHLSHSLRSPWEEELLCPTELFWWQQLIPSCSLDGDCFGLVGCRQETRTSWDSAYGPRFVALGTLTMKRQAGSPVHVHITWVAAGVQLGSAV